MEDKDIVELYWARNEQAIRETELKYGNYCFSVALNILNNTEDAQESVNDAYIHLWNSIPPHRPKALSAFLGKITRFICLKRWRDMHAQKRGGGETALVYEELAECIPSGNTIDDEIEAKELTGIIDSFLATLPKTERQVFVCRYWYFDSIEAISSQFGFSKSKVKSMLYRTRGKLRCELKKEGVYIEN